MPSPPRRDPRAAGVLFFLLPIAGLMTGAVLRQPSIGLVAGIASAVVLSIAFWAFERGRR